MSITKRKQTKCTNAEALKIFAERHQLPYRATETQVILGRRRYRDGVTIDLRTGELTYDSDFSSAAELAKQLTHPAHADRCSDEYNLCVALTKFPDAEVQQDADGFYYLEIETEPNSERVADPVYE